MKVLYYIQIGMGSVLTISAGTNIAILPKLSISGFLTVLVIEALMASYGIFNIRKGWRELNKIEEMKK